MKNLLRLFSSNDAPAIELGIILLGKSFYDLNRWLKEQEQPYRIMFTQEGESEMGGLVKRWGKSITAVVALNEDLVLPEGEPSKHTEQLFKIVEV